MSELNENNNNIEKITNGVISYLQFLKKFKTKISDLVITNEQNPNSRLNMSYIIREFKLDCYIIDKKNFDYFRSSINFNELAQILNTINEENKEKFKKELKQFLDKHPYTPKGTDIRIYSSSEELKEIVKNFNNYSFVNKELLFDVMGAPKSKIEESMLKVSKNEKNTSLYSFSGNFLLTINIEKKDKENQEKIEKKKIEVSTINIKQNKKFKNLYYVDKITLKIMILLYANEKIIEKKIKNPIKNKYNFKKYYLINKDWLKEYKEFFLYDFVIKKIEEDPELNDPKYSYKNIKYNLENIVNKKIRQIPLGDTEITEKMRNANNLFHKVESIQIKKEIIIKGEGYVKQETESSQIIFTFIDIPTEFELIDEETFKLLMQEEFFINFDDNIKDKLQYLVMFGNNTVIIKNKNINKIERLKAFKEYLIFSKKSLKKNINKEENIQNDSLIIDYLLDYGKEESFFSDFEIILKKNGLKEFMTSKDLDIYKLKFEQNIRDDKSIYGKFINFNINEEDIINEDNGNIINPIPNDNNKNESINNNINKNTNNEIQNGKINDNNIINKNHNNNEEKIQNINNKIDVGIQNDIDDFHEKENNNDTNENLLGSFIEIEKNNNKLIVKENDINYFKKVEEKINENKHIKNIKKYMNLKFKDIKLFYLINEEWLNLKINGWEQELTIKPKIEKANFFYSFPINFGFLEEKDSEELIKKISREDKRIKNDLYISRIIFVNGIENNPNSNVYFGVLNDNYICFYLLSSKNYYPEFLINYNSKNILSKEIDEGIMQKGIENYLNEMGIMDLSNKKTHPLYNFKLEKIGSLYVPKEKDIIKINNSVTHSKCLNYIKDSYYYNSVIQCLVNIGLLKNIFANRNYLIDNKIVGSHKNLTKKFYELFQSMWNYSPENENIINNELREEILGFSCNIDIFKDIKVLIEFILLSIHSEQKSNENNTKIIYNLKIMKNEFNNTYSFLNQLFSFNVKYNCNNCKGEDYTKLCMLNLDIDKINSKSIGHTINFISLLKTEKFEILCNNCQKTISSKISFSSFPIILIIVIKSKNNGKFKFDYIEKLELQNFFDQDIGGNFQYELIDIIKCKDRKVNNFDTEIYCKLSNNINIWNKYTQTENGQECQKIDFLDKDKISEDIPYLLIYQKIDR